MVKKIHSSIVLAGITLTLLACEDSILENLKKFQVS